MEDWVTPKGAGRTSSTWLRCRCGATVCEPGGELHRLGGEGKAGGKVDGRRNEGHGGDGHPPRRRPSDVYGPRSIDRRRRGGPPGPARSAPAGSGRRSAPRRRPCQVGEQHEPARGDVLEEREAGHQLPGQATVCLAPEGQHPDTRARARRTTASGRGARPQCRPPRRPGRRSRSTGRTGSGPWLPPTTRLMAEPKNPVERAGAGSRKSWSTVPLKAGWMFGHTGPERWAGPANANHIG